MDVNDKNLKNLFIIEYHIKTESEILSMDGVGCKGILYTYKNYLIPKNKLKHLFGRNLSTSYLLSIGDICTVIKDGFTVVNYEFIPLEFIVIDSIKLSFSISGKLTNEEKIIIQNILDR